MKSATGIDVRVRKTKLNGRPAISFITSVEMSALILDRAALIRDLKGAGITAADFAERSVADRLREITERPVLFTVDMEDGREDYVLDDLNNIRRTDDRASSLEYGALFGIRNFEAPPESDLTIHYPTEGTAL